jgi:hypothetical protein
MPEKEIARRGGSVRYRTICPHGKTRGHCDGPYRRVAVVRVAGPRGGRTVAGPEHGKQE